MHALVGQDLGRVLVGPVGEGAEHDMAMVDEHDAAPADVQVVIALRHDLVDQVGQRAGYLDPCRTGAHDDEGQCSLVQAGGIEVGVLEDLQDPVPETLGVDRRVEGEGVLGSPGYAEEVGLGAHRQHEVVPGERLPVRPRDRPGVGVHSDDLALLYGHGLVLAEHGAQRAADVGRGELRGGHLVEQRLELVVVVAVDQRDLDPGVGQHLGAPDAREAAPDDHHARRAVPWHPWNVGPRLGITNPPKWWKRDLGLGAASPPKRMMRRRCRHCHRGRVVVVRIEDGVP